MQGFVDIHHHFLYGLDDGPQTRQEMYEMLDRAAEEGVSCIVATPHMQAGRAMSDENQYQRSLMEARQYVDEKALPLRLIPGAEIFYTSSTTVNALQGGSLPRLGNGYHVLVEFDPGAIPFEGICSAAVHIANVGCTMVLAHAERYRCLRQVNRLSRLQEEYHILIQVNASSILHPRNIWEKRWIRRAMENHWIDIVSSDAHDTIYRPCLLGQCASYIEKKWGRQTAEKLCCLTPAYLLKDC